MHRVGAAFVMALGCLTFGGCSEDESSELATMQEEIENLPLCSVWVDGQTLPKDYTGSCRSDTGVSVSGLVNCEDGTKFATQQG